MDESSTKELLMENKLNQRFQNELFWGASLWGTYTTIKIIKIRVINGDALVDVIAYYTKESDSYPGKLANILKDYFNLNLRFNSVKWEY